VIETRHFAAAWAWCFAVFLLIFAECIAKPHLEGTVGGAIAGRAATLEVEHLPRPGDTAYAHRGRSDDGAPEGGQDEGDYLDACGYAGIVGELADRQA
jgi:hypothetical protein